MTTARQHRAPGLRPRLSRILTAVAASAALVVAPVLVAVPAQAVSDDSVTVTVDDGDTTWASFDLPLMTEGAAYTGSITNKYNTWWHVENLPAGITVSPPDSNGSYMSESSEVLTFSGTPTVSGPVTVRVHADLGEGSTDITILFTIAPASVAPVWIDDTLGAFQQGVAYSDGVAASGGTVGYSVTNGTLPAGLALDAVTGVVTGTPASAGAYDFTITASNGSSHIDQSFTGMVAPAAASPAAPTIDLSLNFQTGTAIGDASSTISAGGLKVGSPYTLTMHSAPVILYTGIIDGSGGFTWKVALPANTLPGTHQLILTGVAPDGTTLTRNAWFTLGAGGTITAVSLTGPTRLADTGVADPSLPLGIALSLLLSGALALTIARRRRPAAASVD
jgi:hypothetical protein